MATVNDPIDLGGEQTMEKDLESVSRTNECMGGALSGKGPGKCAQDRYVHGWGTYQLSKRICMEASP